MQIYRKSGVRKKLIKVELQNREQVGKVELEEFNENTLRKLSEKVERESGVWKVKIESSGWKEVRKGGK